MGVSRTTTLGSFFGPHSGELAPVPGAEHPCIVIGSPPYPSATLCALAHAPLLELSEPSIPDGKDEIRLLYGSPHQKSLGEPYVGERELFYSVDIAFKT